MVLDTPVRDTGSACPYLLIWGSQLKTTIEIGDELAIAAKAHAAREKDITLRALIEHGLRPALRSDRDQGRFKLRDASVGGRGLQPQFRDADWTRIRETVYEDRGS